MYNLTYNNPPAVVIGAPSAGTAMNSGKIILFVFLGFYLFAVSAFIIQSDFDQLIERLRNGHDEWERMSAAKKLGALGDTRAIPYLLDALKDHPYVMISASAALGKFGDSALIPVLQLIEDENADAREGVARALGIIGSERAIPALIKLTGDSDVSVREHAIIELGRIGSSDAVEPLISLLNDNVEYVTVEAAIALGRIGDSRAVEPLLSLLASRHHPDIQRAVIEALGEIGDSRAILPIINVMRERFTHSLTRHAAVDSLAQFDTGIVLPNLIAIIEASEDPELNDLVCMTIGTFGESAISSLHQILKHGDDNARYWAVSALWRIGYPAVDSLLEALKDPSEKVRENAAYIFKYIKADEAVIPLIKLLADESDRVRISAAISLGEIGDPKATDKLIELLASSNEVMIQRALEALEKIKNPKAIDPIVRVTNNKNPQIRKAAAKALSEIGGKESEAILNEGMARKDLPFIAGGYKLFISKGIAGSEDILCEALLGHGDADMAVDYLNCGNDMLVEAAKSWARKHGYALTEIPGAITVVWGKTR